MKRSVFNPWTWSLKFGFNQAEVVEHAKRHFVCAGQTAVNAEGAPQHPDDMRAQMMLALDNLETVLQAAEMALSDLTSIRIFVTDMDVTLENFDVVGARLGAAQVMPPLSLIEVSRFAMPTFMVEIEATAAQ